MTFGSPAALTYLTYRRVRTLCDSCVHASYLNCAIFSEVYELERFETSRMTYNEGHSRSLILTLVDRPRQWLLVTLFAMLHCFHDVSTLDCLWPWEILQQSAYIRHLVHCSHVSASSFVCEKLSWHMLHFVIYMWVKTGVKQVNWHSRSLYSLSRSLILSTFDDRHSRSFYSLSRSLILSTFDVSSSTSFTVVASRFKRSCSLYHRGWRDICLVCLQQQLSL